MCMAMALSEWREYVPTSSKANTSLAVPTCLHSALTTAMMIESLMERRYWGVEQLLIGVEGSHPYSRNRRKTLKPSRTEQAAGDSDWK